jgi:hypothetical protein
MSDFIGLPGFIMRPAYSAAYPKGGSKEPVYLQGSRQMDSSSRSYYEKNLGAGYFASLDLDKGFMGYTEPLRRFIQPEGYDPQVNEIQNQMPSWMPGEDYLVNFQKGDPYIKVDEGYARLPGTGYEAMHRCQTRCLLPPHSKTPRACAREGSQATHPSHPAPPGLNSGMLGSLGRAASKPAYIYGVNACC